jgi:hypothetical protein
MKVTAMKIKLFNKIHTVYRAFDANGELVRVFDTKEEADAWMSLNA